MARHLILMGSGETSPTMIGVHRTSMASARTCITLDTPYGFQENADELTSRVQRYFADSVGRTVMDVTVRDAESPARTAAVIESVRGADWAFAGPGSPTYALRVWRDVAMASVFDELLTRGTLVLASAAALTAGRFTVPVYEMYKVGEDPHWRDGLDVLGRATGMSAAVIPHFDNAEGGTHDTRYCYMGERRLAALEHLLPADTFVLGIDEHTAVDFDLDARVAHVLGRGSMTIRMGAREWKVPTGSAVTFDEIAEQAGTRLTAVSTSPAVAWSGADVEALLDAGDVDAAVDALLALDGVERDIETRSAVHALVLRLGRLAANPQTDPATIVGPYVEALLTARASARAHGFWAEADEIRDRLTAMRVVVTDTKDGAVWSLQT